MAPGSRAHAIRAPLLAIVGERDGIIPPVHSKRLFDAWGEPKRWVAIPNADEGRLNTGGIALDRL